MTRNHSTLSITMTSVPSSRGYKYTVRCPGGHAGLIGPDICSDIYGTDSEHRGDKVNKRGCILELRNLITTLDSIVA